jgi:hypothetical protein
LQRPSSCANVRRRIVSAAALATNGRTAGDYLYLAKLPNNLKIHSEHFAMPHIKNHLVGPATEFTGPGEKAYNKLEKPAVRAPTE